MQLTLCILSLFQNHAADGAFAQLAYALSVQGASRQNLTGLTRTQSLLCKSSLGRPTQSQCRPLYAQHATALLSHVTCQLQDCNSAGIQRTELPGVLRRQHFPGSCNDTHTHTQDSLCDQFVEWLHLFCPHLPCPDSDAPALPCAPAGAFRAILASTPQDLLPTVYLCTNRVAPAHAGIELGVGDATLIKVWGGVVGCGGGEGVCVGW
jgi:hypothetical protein